MPPQSATAKPSRRRTLQVEEEKRPLLFVALFVVIAGLAVFMPKAVRSAASGAAPGETVPEHRVFLPHIEHSGDIEPPPTYDSIPVLGPAVDRPAEINGDLNLALRGYVTTTTDLELININGPTDTDAPQLAGIFDHQRMPSFEAAYQVRDWDWSCDDNGCPADPITDPPVTLLALGATPGEALYIPTRNAEIHGGGYKAMVLYATSERLTLTYTREDTPAIGYVVHLEGIAVESTLVERYNEQNEAGREELPALRSSERVGRASGATVKVVIRDTGSFMDTRSRKDWWRGYLHSR